MLIIYLILNILLLLFSLLLYRTYVNPISIYSVIWTIAVTLYEIKLIYYYDLKAQTWLVIIGFQLLYIFGCIFSFIFLNIGSRSRKINNININEEKKQLKKLILILTFIGSISHFYGLYEAINLVGFDLLNSTYQLYAARLNGEISQGIPYLGVLNYVSLIFSGVYIKKFGFEKFIFLPIIIIAISSLKSGGRTEFIIGSLLIIFPVLFLNHDNSIKFKKNKRNLIIGISIFILLFLIVTVNRSAHIEIDKYTSPFLGYLMKISPAFHKIYHYFASPIGVLNEYLKNPDYNFSKNTFKTLYNFINKFGFKIKVNTYQDPYWIPLKANAGTYIRALIQDFKFLLSGVVAFLLGLVFSYNYIYLKLTSSYLNVVWSTVFGYIVFMSFFNWGFKSSTFWIILFVGTIISLFFDKKIIISSN